MLDAPESDDAQITDDGLKDLPRSLTTLSLKNDKKITDQGLKALPAIVHVIP
jgi:hypothetical protein